MLYYVLWHAKCMLELRSMYMYLFNDIYDYKKSINHSIFLGTLFVIHSVLCYIVHLRYNLVCKVFTCFLQVVPIHKRLLPYPVTGIV